MKPRRIYYRRKAKSIVIEGVASGKPILIWTLPKPEKLLDELMEKSSIFSPEKKENVSFKLQRLDIKLERDPKPKPKVPLTKVVRTPENDGEPAEITQEQNVDIWELTK